MTEAYMAARRVMPVSSFVPQIKQAEDLARSIKADDLALLRESIARVLATDDGKRMFEHLLDITLRAQSLNPFSEQFGGTAEKVAMATAYRTGQNSIPLHFLSLAEQAEGRPGFFQKPAI